MRTYVILKAQFTLGVGVSDCIFENNKNNVIKTQMERMLKFDIKADPNFDLDAKCERKADPNFYYGVFPLPDSYSDSYSYSYSDIMQKDSTRTDSDGHSDAKLL